MLSMRRVLFIVRSVRLFKLYMHDFFFKQGPKSSRFQPEKPWFFSFDTTVCMSHITHRTRCSVLLFMSVNKKPHSGCIPYLSYRKNRILRLFLIFWHSLILHYIHFTQRYLSAKKKETSCVIQYTVVWNKNSHQATSCVKRTVLYWFDCLCLFSLINTVFKCSLSINTC